MDPLTCPKCRGSMRQYERSGVTVDQCDECRGIFLDRGELERLMEAEAVYTGRASTPQGPQPGSADPRGYPPPAGLFGELFGGGQHGRRRGHH